MVPNRDIIAKQQNFISRKNKNSTRGSCPAHGLQAATISIDGRIRGTQGSMQIAVVLINTCSALHMLTLSNKVYLKKRSSEKDDCVKHYEHYANNARGTEPCDQS